MIIEIKQDEIVFDKIEQDFTLIKFQKNFIKKRIKPTVGTPDFLRIISSIMTSTTYNGQCYGDTLMEIHDKYKFCAWLPMALFKMGYIQALTDTEQPVQLNLNYSGKVTVNKAIRLLTGKDLKTD